MNDPYYQNHQSDVDEILTMAILDYQKWFDSNDPEDIATYQAIGNQLQTQSLLNNEYLKPAVVQYHQYLQNVLAEPQANGDDYNDYRDQARILDQIIEHVL